MYFVVMLGTAGSGKSYMTAALSAWMEDQGLDTVKVNLDPAAEWLPYAPDIDVRKHVSARELMSSMGLGPNGALVAAVDMLVSHIDDLANEIRGAKANYVILDTPGQMELFAFRHTGPIIVSGLVGSSKAVGIFMIDPVLVEKASSILSVLLLYASVRVRMGLPLIPVLGKADLLPPGRVEKLLSLLSDPLLLEQGLLEEKVEPGLLDLARSLSEAYASGGAIMEIIEASAKTMYGVDRLYAGIQQVVAGGEDYLTEEPSPRL